MERPQLPLDQVLSVIGLSGRFVGDDPAAPRTHGAFQLALVLDDLAHRLLTPPVLHGLLESTDWRAYLDADPRSALPQEA